MQKTYKVYFFSVFTLAALLIGLSGTGVAFAKATTRQASTHRTTSATCSGWSVVFSTNVSTGSSYLGGVTTVSASDVWAVGYYVNSSLAS